MPSHSKKEVENFIQLLDEEYARFLEVLRGKPSLKEDEVFINPQKIRIATDQFTAALKEAKRYATPQRR